MWRKLRRSIGYWIVGAEPAIVHCTQCGGITSAFCVMHRDQVRAASSAAQRPRAAR